MRHLRIIGLCLAAVFAIAAVTASTASAKKPEWGKCVAQAGGKYLDGACQTKGKGGSFEWKKGSTLPNVPFTGENVGSGGVLSTTLEFCTGPENVQEKRIPKKQCEAEGGKVEPELGTIDIECESEHNTGEASGKNSILNVSVKFKGCKIFGSAPCSNGTEEGEIQVNTLKGELGYINASEHKVGVRLTPTVKHGAFTQFICAGILGTVVGVGNKTEGAWYEPENKGGNDAIISPITPVNAMTLKYTQVFTVNAENQQNVPSAFEGKPISLLEDYTYNAELPSHTTMWSPAGEEITNENTSTEEGEIKG